MSRNRYVMTTALTAILALGFFVIPSQAFAATSDFNASDVNTKTTYMQGIQIQLVGSTAIVNATFSYEVVVPPTHGAITNFNTVSGVLTYTPDSTLSFASDTFQYRVVDDSNSTNTSNNATVTVDVSGNSGGRYTAAEVFADKHPEFNNVKNIPESVSGATVNSVQSGVYGQNLFDVLHYLDFHGLNRNQITDGQFVYLMEHFWN